VAENQSLVVITMFKYFSWMWCWVLFEMSYFAKFRLYIVICG